METLKINLTTTYFAEASFQYRYTRRPDLSSPFSVWNYRYL